MLQNIKSMAVIAAAMLFLIMSLYGLFLQNQNRRLFSELEAQKKELAALRRESEQSLLALENREKEKERLDDEKKAFVEELGKYYETDCQVGAWADTPCPLGVIERLRR